jgi:regulatory protein
MPPAHGRNMAGMSTPRITRLEPQGPKGLRVLVHLDGDERLEVTLEALERCELGVGDALSSDTRKELADRDADVRVREAALHLLSYRARTRRELETKLRQKGFPVTRIRTCLEELEGKGLLDDQAVAAAFVRDRLRHRPRGRSRLVSELRAKGVDADLAGETIEQVFDDEEVTDAGLAREATERWLGRQGAATLRALGAGGRTPDRDKAKRRLYSYLTRRGFGGQALATALEHAERSARERSSA